MASRQALVLLLTSLTAATAVSACSEATKYRVLSFFLDGVPKPDEVPGAEDELPEGGGTLPADTTADQRVAAHVERYAHPPYRDNRCRSCHDTTTGQPYSTPQEGLCLRCHDDLPGEVSYVHGPVAVSDCLFCHHHHASPYPKVLLAEPPALCFRCHLPADLTTGSHHETIDRQSCVECHNPHGGDDRFFLKRDER